jgi:uncharacterized protein YbjQ (UPF0145 family)
MILSTARRRRRRFALQRTPQIEGRIIREYKGIVTGETIIGANGSMLMVATSGTAVVV